MLEIEHANEEDKVPSGMTEIKPEEAVATPIDVDDTEFDDIEDFGSSEDNECLIGGITNKLTNKLIFWVCILIILMGLIAIALDAQIERRFNKIYDQMDQMAGQEQETGESTFAIHAEEGIASIKEQETKQLVSERTIVGELVSVYTNTNGTRTKYYATIASTEIKIPKNLYEDLTPLIGQTIELEVEEVYYPGGGYRTFNWKPVSSDK